MKLYEYEGKAIFEKNSIPIPRGIMVENPEDAARAAAEIGFPVTLKAQIYSGKRGKGGGILFAGEAGEVKELAGELFGKRINNLIIEKILVEERMNIKEEYYASVMSNPNTRKPVVIFSRAGGMDVEDSFENSTAYHDVDIIKGFRSYDAMNLLKKLGLAGKEMLALSAFLVKLYDIYWKYDCKLVEVNPLALTDKGFVALDSKVEIDDDATFRQKELNLAPGEDVGNREPTALELLAGEIDHNDHRGSAHFVQIDPDGSYTREIGKIPIGFDGVGTGVALVMMDELVPLGFYPVNFCDTSGNPTASKLYRITKIIFAQEGIEGYVFISCISSQQLDNTARGIIKALKEIYPETGGCPDIPCIFVFRGAWDDVAMEMFKDHGLADCEWVEVHGRDMTEKDAALRFAELHRKWAAKNRK